MKLTGICRPAGSKNRNGVTSWRVSGWLHAVRVRKNFKTREDAAAEKAALEVKSAQAASGLRPAATLLTEVQLREAELAFRRLETGPCSLLACLDYALANRRDPEQQKPLSEAVAAYLAGKTQEHNRTLLSGRQLRSIAHELAVFKRYFPDGLVSQFTPADPDDLHLERGKPSLKTNNNRRGLLSTFFKFALRQDPGRPSTRVEKTRTIGSIVPPRLSNHDQPPEQAAELMAYLETFEGGALVPH